MNIAILGYGTVGSGCMDSLQGTDIHVKYVLDRRDIPEVSHILIGNMDDILNDPEVELVAELMGGEHPAYDFVRAALISGKHAVTANKQMMSHHFKELTELAKEHKVQLRYSATAGGGIPWLESLKRAASTDEILELGGVMNGTTNYILDAMQTKGESYEAALKKAQELGFAEADPTADVEGLDVRAKLAISCNIAFGGETDPESIATQGITGITEDDVKAARAEGKVIRLVARASLKDASIGPQWVGPENPMYTLSGPENLFYFVGKRSGMMAFRGAGAGKGPTGANVAADILNIAGLL